MTSAQETNLEDILEFYFKISSGNMPLWNDCSWSMWSFDPILDEFVALNKVVEFRGKAGGLSRSIFPEIVASTSGKRLLKKLLLTNLDEIRAVLDRIYMADDKSVCQLCQDLDQMRRQILNPLTAGVEEKSLIEESIDTAADPPNYVVNKIQEKLLDGCFALEIAAVTGLIDFEPFIEQILKPWSFSELQRKGSGAWIKSLSIALRSPAWHARIAPKSAAEVKKLFWNRVGRRNVQVEDMELLGVQYLDVDRYFIEVVRPTNFLLKLNRGSINCAYLQEAMKTPESFVEVMFNANRSHSRSKLLRNLEIFLIFVGRVGDLLTEASCHINLFSAIVSRFSEWFCQNRSGLHFLTRMLEGLHEWKFPNAEAASEASAFFGGYLDVIYCMTNPVPLSSADVSDESAGRTNLDNYSRRSFARGASTALQLFPPPRPSLEIQSRTFEPSDSESKS